jgi:lambda family phage portal protein
MALTTLNLDLPSFAQIRSKQAAARLEAARRNVRTYKAALPTNQTSDWSLAQTSANAEVRRSLRGLRARSRELQRNNALFKRFIWMMGQNIVGPEGMTLSDVVDGDEENELDAELNEQIIKAFREWSLPENASTSGKLSWADQQKLAIETVARDGEVLIRKRIDAPNKFGFALQFLDVTWLDETFNAVLNNGNRVLMSVELDSFDKPVAYWLTRPSSDFLYPEYGPLKPRTRVPAEEIMHLFIVTEHEAQARGVPHGHAVMEMLNTLNGYVDGELYKNRAAACVTDYLIPPKNDEHNEFYEKDELQSVEGFESGAVRELDTAVQQILPPGWDIKSNDPNLPAGNFDPFVKGAERYVASGLNVPYFRLASDLEGVNYTSSRAGDNDARDLYRFFQRWLRDHFCRPVIFAWAREQLLHNAAPIRALDYARLNPTYNARGWDSVDPEKDSNAAVNNIDNALDTHTRVLAERGLDFRQVVKKLKRENQQLADAGIVKPSKLKAQAAPPPRQGELAESADD